ncbi:MAG: hypothetical protein JWO46_2676, partial [Nocardioidaceae bacterium]|nr:hypothetical protein [Nocardioidaceae bacterium]
SVEPDAARVLTDVVPSSPPGVALVLATLVGGGSVVWVARPAPERWAERATAERVTRSDRV